MTERWARLERLYHEAAALPPSDRDAFLDLACGTDAALRAELDAMLRHEDTHFLEDAPPATGGGSLAGHRLGVYEVGGVIGRGGMGEVYRARDTVLGRDVAIKVLPPESLSNAGRRMRFELEARILASLNHPNIANIFELDTSGGESALVMELVEGETLRERIAEGRVPLREAIALASQMADGLAAAHEAGVIHRDFKPENVKISSTGLAKILDFGIAIIQTGPTAAAGAGDLTRTGEVVGTAAYMSPEQARGKPIDRRTDVWAFGCVLYEMLTGSPAFGGDNAPDRIAAVLEHEPDWNALSRVAPPALVKLIQRMLARDTRERLRDVGDARLELQAILAEPVPQAARGARRVAATWTLLGGIAIGIAAAAVIVDRAVRDRAPLRVTNLAVPLPRGTAHRASDTGAQIAVAPDGRSIAYVAVDPGGRSRLYLQSLDSADEHVLRNTEGARDPFFSPDGKWLGFVSEERFMKLALPDGAAQPFCASHVKPGDPVWLDDGSILYAERGDAVEAGILRMSSDCAHVEVLTRPDRTANELAHFAPQRLPQSSAVIFTSRRNLAGGVHYQVNVVPAPGRPPQLLIGEATRAEYVGGTLLFQRGTSVFATTLDQSRWVLGPSRLVADNVDGSFVSGWHAVRDLLVYRPAIEDARTLVWVTRDGREEPIPAPPRRYFVPTVSPRGDRIATEVQSGPDVDVWMYDIERDLLRRATFDGISRYPEWTPDGSRLTIARRRAATHDIYWLPVDGGAPELLKRNDQISFVDSWTRDQRTLIYSQSTRTGSDLWTYDRDSGRATPLLVNGATKYAARLSPDQRLVAYVSNATGRFELFVADYPAMTRQWQLTSDGAREPLWSREGRELFYRNGDELLAIPIESTEPFVTGHPRTLFSGPYFKPGGPGIRSYDAAPGAQRFLMMRTAATGSALLRVVQNVTAAPLR